MRIEEDDKLDFDDVLIRPKRSLLRSRKNVSLERIFQMKHSDHIWRGIPLLVANMDHIGTFDVADVLSPMGITTVINKFETKEKGEIEFKLNPLNRIPSIGSSDVDFQFIFRLFQQTEVNIVCVDVANGYGEYFSDFIERLREYFLNAIIIAGNVATYEMTEQLLIAGADIIKVGIGSGSVCTTRLKTGVGYPQLSAVIECADAAHGLGGLIISDGGCTTPGDVAKAFGAGADFVMLGGMLAGHDETGDVFHGSSSKEAQEGVWKDYRAAEGKEVVLPNRGPLKDTVRDILGGLRSTCTYCGASSLKQLSKCTTFIKVNNTHNRVFE